MVSLSAATAGPSDDNIALRQMYPGVTAGYHLNKRHWNTVVVADVPLDEVGAMIDASYDLVVASLPKATRAASGRTAHNALAAELGFLALAE